ncbi:MAG: nickel-dependent lactate racemase [Christensenellaceae bacterium]|nr:nickel-dependent lactate racemase [Christensenellaceae bacterium]
MKVELAFAKTKQSVEIDDKNILDVLTPNEVKVELTGGAEVERALANPIGSKKLSEIVKPGEKIAIITSDITRPMPSKIVMPYVIAEIEKAGCDLKDITVVFALGSHRSHTDEEKRYLVGDEVFEKVNCVDSDGTKCIHLGTTKAGTPVDVFEPVAKADRLICMGNIEFHYFAGYSGGAKAIMPGVSTHDAIQKNHSMMVNEDAHAGKIEGNPIREDIDSVVEFRPIDFIVNVVLNEKKEIIKAVAGHHIEAHREGCKFLDQLYKKEIEEKADIVLVSPGGYPKDINLYQAQKGLDNSKHAVKDGGVIILVASCKEGLGEKTFERWMTTSESVDFMAAEIGRHFELGGHKAAAIAMVMQKAEVYLVSDLEEDFVKGIFFKPFKTLEDAYKAAQAKLGEDAKVIVMPYGGSTLPNQK